jgi:hypothetical protein
MAIQSNRACRFVSDLCNLKSTDWCWPEYLALPPTLLGAVKGVPAAMPAAVEQGLTHAKYWLLQAYEQLEKVGPAGSPVGEDGEGDTTPGVACAKAVAVPQSKRRKTSVSLIARPL